MEQIRYNTLYRADMARHTPWSRYGMASELNGADMAWPVN